MYEKYLKRINYFVTSNRTENLVALLDTAVALTLRLSTAEALRLC